MTKTLKAGDSAATIGVDPTLSTVTGSQPTYLPVAVIGKGLRRHLASQADGRGLVLK